MMPAQALQDPEALGHVHVSSCRGSGRWHMSRLSPTAVTQEFGPAPRFPLPRSMAYSLCSCSLSQCVGANLSTVQGTRPWPPGCDRQACSCVLHASCNWGQGWGGGAHMRALLPAASLGSGESGVTVPLMQSESCALSTTQAGLAPRCPPPLGTATSLSGTGEAVN